MSADELASRSHHIFSPRRIPLRVSGRGQQDEVYYEFEGKDARSVEIDVEVRADGKVILIADDDAN